MSRDYKPAPRGGGGRGSSMLTGILIGLVLGLGLALAVAWYINKMPNPFAAKPKPAPTEAPKPAAKAGKSEEKVTTAPDAAPRFDFYKILPGSEEAGTDNRTKEAAKASTVPAKEAFFLQAGAFQSAPDADNLKARLALLGVDSSIQTSNVPEKGVLHRVRVGPYTSIDDVNRTRETLKQNGLITTLIRVRETEQ
jgi:cell division protein FtsN